MKKESLLIGTLGLMTMFAACNSTSNDYTITGTLPDSTMNGITVYIQNLESRTIVDSAVIDGNKVVFSGIASDTAKPCRIVAGSYYNLLILENGNIRVDFDKEQASTGTTLNNELSHILSVRDSLRDAYNHAYQSFEGTKEEWKTIYDNAWKPRLDQQITDFFNGHTDDAVGFYLLDFLYGMETEKQLAIIKNFGPWLANTQTVVKMKSALESQKNTAVGLSYTDINGTDINGNPISLSSFVGKGNYVLVDMWASWCGPCRREIPNLAKLNNLYKDKGLTIVGIYVWDKAENLKPAMEKEGITWPQIIDSEETATKLYGVQGIPCIMLIGPDGTILDRTNLRGDNMQPTVEKYMFGEKK